MDSIYGVSIIANPSPVQPENFTMRDAESWRMMGGSVQTAAGVRVSPRKAIGHPPIFRAVSIIANRIASLPLDVFKRNGDDREAISGHKGAKILQKTVGQYRSARTFRKVVASHAVFYGNGYAALERNTRGEIKGAYLLDPTPGRTEKEYVNGEPWYFTWIRGERVPIHARDVFHLKGYSEDGETGIDMISVMREAIAVGIAAQEYGARYFGNGSNAGGILMIPGAFSEEKIRNTMSAWDKMNKGLTQSHKVALLQDGVKFQQLTITNEQAQFLQTRAFEIRSTISNMFGIPPHMLGDDTRTSHNSLEQENQSFLDDCLDPWLDEIEAEADMKLLSKREFEGDTHFFEFNREALVRMEFEKKINGLYRQVEMGALTLNEVRQILNLAGIGPDGDKRFHPANWVVSGQEAATVTIPPAIPEQTGDNQQPNQPGASVLRAMIASSVTKSLQIEKDRVIRAAKTATNFCESLDNVYQTWSASLSETLGWKSPEVVTAIAWHCETSKKQLINTAGVSTTGTLEANVRDVVACWDGRAETLIDKLCEAANS